MNVLFVTSEAFPLIKTGGLADVSGALPKAIQNLSDFQGEVKILMPCYNAVLAGLGSTKHLAKITALGQQCNLLIGTLPNTQIEVITIQNAALFERTAGPYNDQHGVDWVDNALRFGVLSRIASFLSCPHSALANWLPDIVHCNDWQAGLAPLYMKLIDKSPAKSIFSIHNMAFQGNFDAGWLSSLELPASHFNINGFEFHHQISFLKAGIFYADQISTVSPTYASEIQTEDFGFGMQGLLKSRRKDLIGILNGIDTHEWNPATDPHLPNNYSRADLANKHSVKQALQSQLGLQVSAESPLLGVVSRLTHQKGLDLVPPIMPALIESGCQFVILGSGEKALEADFMRLKAQYPTQVSVTIGYNEPLSHNIMAGCDMFIMPSRFEPCGLNQLYGLAYGTPPIVTSTGGLADSVCNLDDGALDNNTANGFIVKNVTSASLLGTIERAIATWRNKDIWRRMISNGMEKDVSWASSAKLYLNLYRKMVGSKH